MPLTDSACSRLNCYFCKLAYRPVYSALLGPLAAVLCASVALAQSNPGLRDSGAVPAATAPAEQNNADNPPLSGLDQPVAAPAFGGRSYLVPGLQISESIDSNAVGTTSKNAHTSEITRALGSVDMQKIWRQYQFGLDYIAGGDFYAGPLISNSQGRATQVHTLAAVQRILWRTGQLALRDSFNYLPEGSFGFSSYGGAAAFGSSLGSGTSGIGAGTGLGGGIGGGTPAGLGATYGSVAYQPRINNTSVVDIVQGLSPRSAVTLAGGYNFINYLDKASAPFPIINTQQLLAQIGYSRTLNRKDQIGAQYAFEELHFPQAGSGSINAHVWRLLYGHRISGKLNFTIGGGPQLVVVHNPPSLLPTAGPTTKSISGNGSLTFSYTVSSRTSVQLTYEHYITPGSGLYAGANTDAARLSLAHLFGRHWMTSSDLGYSYNSSVQAPASASSPGAYSRSYHFFYAGTSLQRQLGKQFALFVSYQYNDMGLSSCATGTTGICGQASRRHTGMIGINWHPRPIRLD